MPTDPVAETLRLSGKALGLQIAAVLGLLTTFCGLSRMDAESYLLGIVHEALAQREPVEK